ncbi:hypothetical protein L0Y49_04380 [bacterium]|nr:hypothetical protein [bacterium]
MFGRRAKRHIEIDPDEVFLDSRNLPAFDRHQLEGRIERPITRMSALSVAFFFFFILAAFGARVGFLQIAKGAEYTAWSEENRLRHTPIFPNRGVIFDRNGTELAWNIPGISDADFSERRYADGAGLSHVLGYVSYPARDKNGLYYQVEVLGKDGVESYYDASLRGRVGTRIVETDALQEVKSSSVIHPPEDGENMTLTIDLRIQGALTRSMQTLSEARGFAGGAGILMDVENGEIIALANIPEFDSNVMTAGESKETVAEYLANPGTPFLNRAVAGLYTPGSIVKPFMAVAILNEGIMTPEKKVESTGEIRVANPYSPGDYSVFTDWRAHGWVDMRRAIAVSSNVYFYIGGGGFGGIKGLGISNIEKYMRLFGFGERSGIDLFGEKQGIIPNPEWKEKTFEGDIWRLGDTYNTAIGQYGFQVTPISVVRGVAAIANGGTLVTPHIVSDPRVVRSSIEIDEIPDEYFQVAREGMRQSVTEGIAGGLRLPYLEVAGKTGTAEIGSRKQFVNSWITGFFPYDKPRYAFAIVMERGPRENLTGAVFAMRSLLEWMHKETPEYFK